MVTTKNGFLDNLWESAARSEVVFSSEPAANLPDVARRYLEHAIAPGTPLASAVRLRMHGEIKLQRRWRPFRAEQVLCRGREMIWNATVRMNGLPIRGFDRLVNGAGAMQWRLLGIIPLMSASGPDITRSALGRIAGESVWLPSALCSGEAVTWTALSPNSVQANFLTVDEPAKLTLTVDERGRLQTVSLPRWGNPEGAAFHYADFGGFVEQENTFAGYTIPTRLRLGWHFGTDRFEPEGEFFRVTIDGATYR
jgi:hypothetical protein